MVGIFLVVDAPEWQRQVPAVLDVQTVQKTAYCPQLQLLDKVLDEPVVVQRLVLWSGHCRKPSEGAGDAAVAVYRHFR